MLYVATVKGENIIFEQIGTLSGATSYLHPHVTINISSIERQYNLYRAFVLQEIERTSSASAMAAGPTLHGSTRPVFSDPKAEFDHYMKESRFNGADDIVDEMAKRKKFPPQSRDAGPELRRTEEYRWRTKTMNQLADTAISQMVKNARTSSITKEMEQAREVMRKTWHKIARLHWEDVIEIGLHLASIKEHLPQPEPDSQRIIAPLNFFREVKVPVTNILTEDLGLQTQYNSQEDYENTQKYRRALQQHWDKVEHPGQYLPDEDERHARAFHIFHTREPLWPEPGNIKIVVKPPTSPPRNFEHLMRSLDRRQDQTPNPWVPTIRKKRIALEIAALGVAVAAVSIGVYNTAQVEFLTSELTEVKENTGRLFEIADRQEIQHEQMTEALRTIGTYLVESTQNHPALYDSRLSRVENQLKDRLRQTTHVLQAAQMDRLSIDYLSPTLVARLLTAMKEKASDWDYELLINHPSDLYQLETSLLYDGVNAHLLVHVPMAPRKSLLRLFRLHPFPLPVFEDNFMVPKVNHDVLAISNTENRQHLQLSSADLQSCRKLGTHYLCDQFGVQHKGFDNSCLGALYGQNFEDARKMCEFTIEPATERIYSLRQNQYMVYLTTPMTVPLTCRDPHTKETYSMEKHLARGAQQFQLHPGCRAIFREHVVYSDMSIKMPSDTMRFNWDWQPLQMFGVPAAIIPQELKLLQRFGVTRPTLSDLNLVAANSISKWVDTTWDMPLTKGLITGGVIVTVVSILCIIGFLVFKHKQWLKTRSKIPIAERPKIRRPRTKNITRRLRRPQETLMVRYINNPEDITEPTVEITRLPDTPRAPPRTLATVMEEYVEPNPYPNPYQKSQGELRQINKSMGTELHSTANYLTCARAQTSTPKTTDESPPSSIYDEPNH